MKCCMNSHDQNQIIPIVTFIFINLIGTILTIVLNHFFHVRVKKLQIYCEGKLKEIVK